jgi:hypothetical protein
MRTKEITMRAIANFILSITAFLALLGIVRLSKHGVHVKPVIVTTKKHPDGKLKWGVFQGPAYRMLWDDLLNHGLAAFIFNLRCTLGLKRPTHTSWE